MATQPNNLHPSFVLAQSDNLPQATTAQLPTTSAPVPAPASPPEAAQGSISKAPIPTDVVGGVPDPTLSQVDHSALVENLVYQLNTNDSVAVTDPVVPEYSVPGIKEAVRQANDAGVGKFGALLVDVPKTTPEQLHDIALDVMNRSDYQVLFIRSFSEMDLVGSNYPAVELATVRDKAKQLTVDNQEFIEIISQELAEYDKPPVAWPIMFVLILVIAVALTALWEIKTRRGNPRRRKRQRERN